MQTERIGSAIKVLRKRIGYTQNDLAEALGVTDKAVSKWERGLSTPDISIVTQLSLILNCDVDNLLEGNISFLEKTWQGLLILKDNNEKIYSGTSIYGKPLVYFLLCYFMLAGIQKIYIFATLKDVEFIKNEINESKLGISVFFLETIKTIPKENTMVVYDNPFIYGPNLTKYFQRAMSKNDRITMLTVVKGKGGKRCSVNYDNYKVLDLNEGGNCYCVPICFVSASNNDVLTRIDDIHKLIYNKKLYAEPMGNGMIEYSINNIEDVYQTSNFIYFLEHTMGKKIYDPYEIAMNRNLIVNKKNKNDINSKNN